MIGIITANFQKMVSFYKEVLGFESMLELEHYVEFKNEGVRFAISTNQVMFEATNHQSFKQEKKGRSLELAFKADTPEEVDKSFANLIAKGAKSIKEPADMPWGQRTAFFADPDGNIHEIFADLK
jgi:uncharacterized glyoxalase superfamily protein PhnB